MRRQLDSRWRQIDKFEQSVKLVGEAKAGWRRKLKEKEGEAEALKVCNFSSFQDVRVILMNGCRRTTQTSLPRFPSSNAQTPQTTLNCGP
jgi:hypothetical protein